MGSEGGTNSTCGGNGRIFASITFVGKMIFTAKVEWCVRVC